MTLVHQVLVLHQHPALDEPGKEHAAERADMDHRKRVEQRVAIPELARLGAGLARGDPVVVLPDSRQGADVALFPTGAYLNGLGR